jgi:glycosyltransferase involved in cell wall biosynthesis
MPSADGGVLLRPLRILHVVGSLNRGGIETWLAQAIARLPRERYQCDFCTYRFSRGAYATEFEQCGCEFHNIPLGSNPLAILRFARRFRRLLREGHYDVVHCHGLLLVGFILFLARMENTALRIGHAHSADRNTGRVTSVANRSGLMLNRALARAFATHCVGCSAEAGEALFGKRWRRNQRYKVIHCGVDLTPFKAPNSADSVRDALGIEPGALVIGHVGSFSVAKNHRFLVEVAAKVVEHCESAVMLLVGDGILRPSIERRCAELGIAKRVIFAGVSSRVPELMLCAMDAFVMPSLHEGLPLVLLEAQAAGLPCLVSDVVSREAMISDDAIQFMPLASGAEAWARAVVSLLKSTTRRTDLLTRMADSDYNVVVSAERLEALYGSAQSGSRGIR